MSAKCYDNEKVSAEIDKVIKSAKDRGMEYTVEFLQYAAAAAKQEYPRKESDIKEVKFSLSEAAIIH